MCVCKANKLPIFGGCLAHHEAENTAVVLVGYGKCSTSLRSVSRVHMAPLPDDGRG